MLIKPNLIAASEQRFKQADFSPAALNRKLGDGPIKMSVEQKQLRQRQLLSQTEDALTAQVGLERIIQGNDLDSINYLAKGTLVSRSVCQGCAIESDRLCDGVFDRPGAADDQQPRIRRARRRRQFRCRLRF